MELEDEPDQITSLCMSNNKPYAIIFVLFDFSRPDTFSDPTRNEIYDVKYLTNEVACFNRNPYILKFLIGTNIDKASDTFDR